MFAPGNKRRQSMRCSTTELHRATPAVGFEPAITRSRGEVTAICATGRTYINRDDALPGNQRKEFRSKCSVEPCKSRRRLRPIVSLLRQGFPFPAACQAEEVTLLYRHWQLPVCGRRFAAARVAHRILRDQARSVHSDDQVEVTGLFATQTIDCASDMRRIER